MEAECNFAIINNMRTETKEKIGNFVSDRARELCAFSLFVIAILLTVSIGTYHGANASSGGGNAVGYVGAHVSFAFYHAFGYGFYLLIICCVGLAVVVFRAKEWLPGKILLMRFFMFAVSVCTASALLHMLYPEPVKLLQIPSGGGLVGKGICSILTPPLGVVGTSIILTAVLLVALTLLFNTNLVVLASGFWSGLCIVGGWIASFARWIMAKRLEEKLDREEEKPPEKKPRDLEVTIPEPKITPKPKPRPQPPPEEPEEKPVPMIATADESDLPPYELPDVELLDLPDSSDLGKLEEEARGKAQILQKVFEQFAVEADIGKIICGPTITCYEVHPKAGVRVNSITRLENEIAMATKATSIRIVAPIPGRDAVGIEIPNAERRDVFFSQLCTTPEYKEKAKKMKLMMALGQMLDGETFLEDLAKTPHLLVAGATGSGKSVCINTILMSLLFRFRPDELKLILVDPKTVEMTLYHDIPHLLVPILTDLEKVPDALDWLIVEMERRYKFFARAGVREIVSFNQQRAANPKPLKIQHGNQEYDVPDFLPYIVLIVDELADLMLNQGDNIEKKIQRLAQLARAAGIHMVLATQRPSTNVITGTIKANIPARIAFKTTSGIDSRVILDEMGSEKLLGMGDMLVRSQTYNRTLRIQGAFVSEEEVKRVTDFVREQREPIYVDFMEGKEDSLVDGDIDYDPKLDEAIQCVINSGNASASYLQRVLSVGYARAARMIDTMEKLKVVGPRNGSKPRDILVESWPPEDGYPLNSGGSEDGYQEEMFESENEEMNEEDDE